MEEERNEERNEEHNEERNEQQERHENDEFHADCPHCGAQIRMVLAVKIRKPLEVSAPPRQTEAPTPRDRLTPAQRAFINAARQTGLMEAFAQAVDQCGHEVPRDLEQYLITVIRTSQQRAIPRDTLKILTDEYVTGPGQAFGLWSAQGIGIITINKEIRGFVPTRLVKDSVCYRSGDTALRIPETEQEEALRQFLKTRHGYAPLKNKLFMDTIRARSFGEFARPNL